MTTRPLPVPDPAACACRVQDVGHAHPRLVRLPEVGTVFLIVGMAVGRRGGGNRREAWGSGYLRGQLAVGDILVTWEQRLYSDMSH